MFGVVSRESVDPAKFGVVLTYALATTSSESFACPIRNRKADVDSSDQARTPLCVLRAGNGEPIVHLISLPLTSQNNVERIQHYLTLPPEPPRILDTDPKAGNWPSKGEIRFDNVGLRYRPDLPLILKNVSFDIRPGEKVGIIGRTGAGKSSVTQALFRMVELAKGRIMIDGLDIGVLGLDTVSPAWLVVGANKTETELRVQLRKGISIIPQEAFLFGGTVRQNLDPSGQISDHDLNAALEKIRCLSGLSEGLRNMLQLDAEIRNEGTNLSAGERQMRESSSHRSV